MLDPKALLGNVNSSGLVGKMLSGMATKNFAAGLLAGGVGGAMMRKGGKDMKKMRQNSAVSRCWARWPTKPITTTSRIRLRGAIRT